MKRELGIARCGLACCLCSENVKCKGCRQDGFKDLAWCNDAEWCENRKCVLEKKINGCYECEPANCRKGLYAEKIKARSFAEFARRYGMEELLDCLERNEKAGIVYHREGIMGDYDDFDDLEKLIDFIKRGRVELRLRPYIPALDFDAIKNWMPDRRGHALWCADRFAFPLDRENFDSVISDHAEHYGDCAFTATDDSGKPVGFFCYSVNTGTNEGMLKFVMVDPAQRGMGYGKEMLRLAVKYAFDITKADAVRLIVFSENPGARKCYEGVGFTEVSTDPGAFAFGDEAWGRCCMMLKKDN